MVTEYDKLVIGEFHHKEGMKEGLEKGLEEGLKKGIEIGREAGAKAIARKMLDDQVPVERIAEWTNLSIEEVKALS